MCCRGLLWRLWNTWTIYNILLFMHVHEHIWTNHRSRRARVIQKSSSRDMLSSSVLLAMNPNFPIYIFSTSFYDFYLNTTSINSLRILHSLFWSSSSHSISLPPPYPTPNGMPPPFLKPMDGVQFCDAWILLGVGSSSRAWVTSQESEP